MLDKDRKFNGKVFHVANSVNSKGMAKSYKDNYKSKGLLVRVVPAPKGRGESKYRIYTANW